MLNKVTLIGNLGADPEQRTAGNKPVVNLRLATTETWKDRNGDRQEKTEWHRITVWGEGNAKYLAYAQKGTTLYIEGKLETRSYESNGETKYSTEIVVNERGGELRILKGGVERE
ncbi:MAG: single-stranded DNA-binding protein [Rubrivivax sp.]|nr:single-stranded DNA-binding protein [Rubrivivax sp.]